MHAIGGYCCAGRRDLRFHAHRARCPRCPARPEHAPSAGPGEGAPPAPQASGDRRYRPPPARRSLPPSRPARDHDRQWAYGHGRPPEIHFARLHAAWVRQSARPPALANCCEWSASRAWLLVITQPQRQHRARTRRLSAALSARSIRSLMDSCTASYPRARREPRAASRNAK